MPPIPVPFPQVERLAQRWFPGDDVMVERMGSGVSTPVYRLTVDGQVSYLRLAEEPGEDRVGEVAAHQQARAVGVSVPVILRFESRPPELDRSATLTAAMPGIPLSDVTGPLPAETVAAIAADLVRLNGIPVQGYGWIDGETSDGVLFAEHPTRAAWAMEYQRAAKQIAAANLFPAKTFSALADAITRWAGLPEDDTASLAHGDFDPSHIYVDPDSGAYQGLIDLGEIRGTDRLYDLGHLLAHAFDPAGREFAERVIAAGETRMPLDRDELCLQAIAIATRALAIQLTRPANAYRANLTTRLTSLLES